MPRLARLLPAALLAAWAVLALGVFTLLLHEAGLLPSNVFTANAPLVRFGVEARTALIATNAYTCEMQLKRRNGELFWVEMGGSCVRPHDPHAAGGDPLGHGQMLDFQPAAIDLGALCRRLVEEARLQHPQGACEVACGKAARPCSGCATRA